MKQVVQNIYITDLMLKDYRNFSSWAQSFTPEMNIIIGPNGSGKTNILEAISFLSPGRGVRGSKHEEVIRHQQNLWCANYALEGKLGTASVEIQYSNAPRQKNITYNGNKITATELVNLSNLVWLTPQMEGLFLDSSSTRRKFLDRIAYNFFPNHLKNLNKYEHFVQERRKVLADNWRYKTEWLDKLENEIVEVGLILHETRKEAVEKMQHIVDQLKGDFPKSKMEILSFLPSSENPAEIYLKELFEGRERDSFTKTTSIGPHKSDFIVRYAANQMLAKLCSTGQQKALLISLTLATIDLIIQQTGYAPILLLDELFVHLDLERKTQLFEYIKEKKLQTFITTTDMIGLEFVKQSANIIKL